MVDWFGFVGVWVFGCVDLRIVRMLFKNTVKFLLFCIEVWWMDEW